MAEPKGFLMVPVGFNPSGDLRALELDANDYLKVALAAWLEGAVDVKGYTGSAWKELLVNASGQAIVVGKGTSEEVNAALLAPARGLVGNNGYIGGAFQKDPLRIGYSGPVREAVANDAHAAGAIIVLGAAVPANTMRVITSISGVDVDTNPTSVIFGAILGGSYHYFDTFLLPGVNIARGMQGYFILAAGDGVFANFFGTALNDRLRLYYSGFYVTLNL